MPRYIEADWLIAEANKDGAYGYVDANQIAKAPTADVVEVVRCKDCKHYEEQYKKYGIGFGDCHLDRFSCEDDGALAEDDGFCKWGERRDDERREP